MSKPSDRAPDEPGVTTATGGENAVPPEKGTHDPSPHDEHAREPLGPLTPDDESPLGASPEVHGDIIPEDLPKDHPGRKEAERLAADGDGTTTGNT